MATLRPYQSEIVEGVLSAMDHGARRIGAFSPPGSGKSVVITKLVEEFIARSTSTLVLCRRKKVIEQLADRVSGLDSVDVRTVQSAARRLDKMGNFGVVVIDEAHEGGVSSQARAVIDANPGAIVIYVTATPTPDLLDACEVQVWGPPAQELTDQGYLAPLRYCGAARPNLSSVRIKNDDYNPSDLMRVMEDKRIQGSVLEAYNRWGRGGPCLGFCVSVKHAEDTAEMLRGHGVPCEVLTAKDKASETERKLAFLEEGGLLLSISRVSAGFDLPNLKSILILRPTLSIQFHDQSLGRVARLKDDGGSGRVIDMVGNCRRLGLFTSKKDYGHREDETSGDKRDPSGDLLSIRECESCRDIWEGSATICPTCGHDNAQDRRISKNEKARLDEIKADEIEAGLQAAKELRKRQGQSIKQMAAWLKKKPGMPTARAAWEEAISNMRKRLARAERERDEVVASFARWQLLSAGVDPDRKPKAKPKFGLDGWPL